MDEGRYIKVKNRGFNETITRKNHINNISKIRWNANYNGNNGNMELDISKNGRNKHVAVHLIIEI